MSVFAQTIPGGDDVFSDNEMVETVWLRSNNDFHANSCSLHASGATRCYMQDADHIYMLEWDEQTGSWTHDEDDKWTKSFGYEDPTQTSCGLTQCDEWSWRGQQYWNLRPWMSGFGGCGTTVWGCNPMN